LKPKPKVNADDYASMSSSIAINPEARPHTHTRHRTRHETGLAPQWRGYVKSKTIIARGIMERFEGGEYVKESNHILERLLTRFQITGLTVTNLFKGGPYLNLVSTSAYFQVTISPPTTHHLEAQ
jgi:hypothetical protein